MSSTALMARSLCRNMVLRPVTSGVVGGMPMRGFRGTAMLVVCRERRGGGGGGGGRSSGR